MASAAEIIAKECPDVDFVDCNIGCPIDLGSLVLLLDRSPRPR